MTRKFFILFLFVNFSNAQGESSIWYFGENAGIKFTDNTVEVLTDSQMNTLEGCATIADVAGDLLFYTDGITVWDKNHNVMLNGTDLLGNFSATQSAVVVPNPENTDLYYIFTVAAQATIDGLRYSEVDMTLNNGNGGVTANKNIQLSNNVVSEKISACKQGNDVGYWVVAHEWNSNNFLSFSITNLGVNLSPVISSVGSIHEGNNDTSIGYLKISPNDKRLALAKYQSTNGVEIFDFDNSTGIVSNALVIGGIFNPITDLGSGAYGVEFSPDSNILYVSDLNFELNQSKVHQFDLTQDTQTNVLNSDTIIYEGNKIVSALQLAIDGKIYASNFSISFLDVIETPNILGNGANYNIESIDLGEGVCLGGLPSFIQSFFSEDNQDSIFVPQGISPNEDGLNDNLDLVNANVSSLKIYNRYGTLVYTKENYTNEWNGQSNNGSLLPVGTYFLSFIYNNDQTHSSWIYLNK
ncbi:gliding motility-associated C-terminal domain-containing protein [Psychroserpens sp. AS72]|uniref:gliding motility-associated C-terminal domain-containing protein n=1 Tax=Psychroserpens sp. AS72 TaxID=3135775 RepID=UPI00317C34B9